MQVKCYRVISLFIKENFTLAKKSIPAGYAKKFRQDLDAGKMTSAPGKTGSRSTGPGPAERRQAVGTIMRAYDSNFTRARIFCFTRAPALARLAILAHTRAYDVFSPCTDALHLLPVKL